MEENLAPEGNSPRRFNTTRWSVVLAAGVDSENAARLALAELCRIYWRPIFAYIARCGHSTMDAQDLTQDFLLSVMEGNLLKRADPERGRFRALLLSSLKNFLHKAHEKGQAQKRGGALQFVSWDDWLADAPSHLTVSRHTLESSSPERLFDIRWAATMVEQAMARLQEEYAERGRRRVFDALSGCLSVEREDIVPYSKLAASLGIAESSVKRLLHRMRLRHRAILREEVARTVDTAAAVEDEIRHLCAVLASAG